MKSLKKIIAAGFLAVSLSCSGAFAQQITKFGVVDTARVYQSYYKDSAPVRNYESKKELRIRKTYVCACTVT